MKVTTASRSALLLECQAWARDDAPRAIDTTEPEAQFGTDIHSACSAYIAREESPTRDAGDERFWRVWRGAKSWIDANRKLWWLTELAFFWGPEEDAARQRGQAGHRDYSGALPGETFAGTADVAYYDAAEDTAHVYDFKTGYDMEHAAPQLRSLCLLAARAWGASRAVGHPIQLTEDGAVECDMVRLDAFQFRAIAGQLAQLLAAIPTSEPNPGLHCTRLYCPARLGCSAATATIAELIPAKALTRYKFTHEIENLEHAAHVLPLYKLAQAQLDAVKEALQAIARREGGIPTSPGKEWRETLRTMPRFDAALAQALLRQLGATPEQVAALTRMREESGGFRECKVGPGLAKTALPRRKERAA